MTPAWLRAAALLLAAWLILTLGLQLALALAFTLALLTVSLLAWAVTGRLIRLVREGTILWSTA